MPSKNIDDSIYSLYPRKVRLLTWEGKMDQKAVTLVVARQVVPSDHIDNGFMQAARVPNKSLPYGSCRYCADTSTWHLHVRHNGRDLHNWRGCADALATLLEHIQPCTLLVPGRDSDTVTQLLDEVGRDVCVHSYPGCLKMSST